VDPERLSVRDNLLNLRWLDRDVTCVYCGYNLRGVPITRNCPECGAGACESLLDELLNEMLGRGATLGELDDARERIAAELAGCPLPAVRLVMDAVREAVASHARRDDVSVAAVVGMVTPREICWAVRLVAQRHAGSVEGARALLGEWGVSDSRDVGRIVRALRRVRLIRLPRAVTGTNEFADLLFFDDAAGGALDARGNSGRE
jgi:uncharacterized repeat protein (TIGR04138 family)